MRVAAAGAALAGAHDALDAAATGADEEAVVRHFVARADD
jgi:hypothetical protein